MDEIAGGIRFFLEAVHILLAVGVGIVVLRWFRRRR